MDYSVGTILLTNSESGYVLVLSDLTKLDGILSCDYRSCLKVHYLTRCNHVYHDRVYANLRTGWFATLVRTRKDATTVSSYAGVVSEGSIAPTVLAAYPSIFTPTVRGTLSGSCLSVFVHVYYYNDMLKLCGASFAKRNVCYVATCYGVGTVFIS